MTTSPSRPASGLASKPRALTMAAAPADPGASGRRRHRPRSGRERKTAPADPPGARPDDRAPAFMPVLILTKGHARVNRRRGAEGGGRGSVRASAVGGWRRTGRDCGATGWRSPGMPIARRGVIPVAIAGSEKGGERPLLSARRADATPPAPPGSSDRRAVMDEDRRDPRSVRGGMAAAWRPALPLLPAIR